MRPITKREESDVHEASVMQILDGRVHRGSGSSPNLKSDGHTKELQVECKMTRQESLSIKVEWLKKIMMEALRVRRVPMLALRFSVLGFQKEDWALVPLRWLAEQLEESEAMKEETRQKQEELLVKAISGG